MSWVQRPVFGQWDMVVSTAPEHPASTTPAPDIEPSAVVNLSDALVLKEGRAFLVSLQDGTVPLAPGHPLGLYLDDCRHLSGHELRVGGARPRLLVASAATGAEGIHELTNPDLVLPDGHQLALQTLQVRLERRLSDDGRLQERIHVHLYGRTALELDLELRLAADFRPMLAIRGMVDVPHAAVAIDRVDGGVRFRAVTSDGVTRTTAVTAEPAPDATDGGTLRFRLALAPGEDRDIHVVHAPGTSDAGGEPSPSTAIARRTGAATSTSASSEGTEAWLAQRTRVRADDELFNRVVQRSLLDLRMLRSPLDGAAYYAAGVPW